MKNKTSFNKSSIKYAKKFKVEKHNLTVFEVAREMLLSERFQNTFICEQFHILHLKDYEHSNMINNK
jgi:hypothetical protein